VATPDLWVEKYRPNTLDGYVFKNEHTRSQIEGWVNNVEGKTIPFPHLLLSGGPGVGKTTLAKIILNILGVNKYDILEINGSRVGGVDDVRDIITGFCSTYPNGDYKVVLIDEGDYLTQNAQAVLRNEMERFNESVRFIITCNLPHKIMGALHSRMQGIHFDALDMEGFFSRALEILTLENVSYEIDDLELYITNSYPDLRKCINLLDQHTINGVLSPLKEASATNLNYMEGVVELFKARRYTDARKMIVSNADINDYEDIFRFLYKNLQLFGEDEAIQSAAVLIIARGLRNHAISADAEINLAACIIELSQL
jgi:DNA polymerase III delta prime subunit